MDRDGSDNEEVDINVDVEYNGGDSDTEEEELVCSEELPPSAVDSNETLPLQFDGSKSTANSLKRYWREGTAETGRAQEKVIDKLLVVVDGMISMEDFKESITGYSRYNAVVCKIVRKNLPHLAKPPYLGVILMGQNTSEFTEEDIWWISPKYPVQIPLLCKAKPGDVLMLYGAKKVEESKAIVLDWTQNQMDVIVVHCSLMGTEEDDCTKNKNILAAFCNSNKIVTHEYIMSHEPLCEVSLFYPDKLEEEEGLALHEDEIVDDPVDNDRANDVIPAQVREEHADSCGNSANNEVNEGDVSLSSNTRTKGVSKKPSKRQDANDSWGSFPDLNESALQVEDAEDLSPASSSSIDYEELFQNGQFLPGPQRPKVIKFRDTAEYTYRTLREIDDDLKKSIKNDKAAKKVPVMCLNTQQFVYGYVIAVCPTNRRESNAHHVRISDETMGNILLRIHANRVQPVLGPEISVGDVIRAHRVTAQVEYDYGTGEGDGSHKLVLSTTPHLNYTLFSFDEESKSIVYNTCAQTLTISDHDKRRAVNLLKHFSGKDQRKVALESQPVPLPDNSHRVEEENNQVQQVECESRLRPVVGSPGNFSAPNEEFLELFEKEVRKVKSPGGKQRKGRGRGSQTSTLVDNTGSEIVQQLQTANSPSSKSTVDENERISNEAFVMTQHLSFLEEDDSTHEEDSHNAETSNPVTSKNNKDAASSQSQKIDTQEVNLDELLDELDDSDDRVRNGQGEEIPTNADDLESQVLSLIDENERDEQIQESDIIGVRDDAISIPSKNDSQSQKIESQSVDLDELLNELHSSSDEEVQTDVKPFRSPRRTSPFRRDSPTSRSQPPRKSPRFHRSPPPDPV